MTDPYLCHGIARPALGDSPPDPCEEEALPDSDYCPEHDPDFLQDEREARAEDLREMERFG